MEKECRKCKLQKPLDSFSLDKNGKLGRRGSCKVCEKPMHSLASKRRYQTNKEKRRQQMKVWAKQNPAKLREYHHKRQKSDINYRVKRSIRARLYTALKENYKQDSSISYLGCDLVFFKEYISNMFTEGMSWDNYGKWHIDHIKPLALFDLSIEEEIKKASHYTNLQPLWAKENLLKRDKY